MGRSSEVSGENMKVTNIKNVVIGALVIVNVFFLAFFIWRSAGDRSEKAEALRDLSTLFGRSGIYMNTDNIREGGELAELQISRDIPGEQKLADTLLGQTEMTDQGGIIYTYANEKGQAVFRNGGEFDITFKPHAYNKTLSAEATVKSLLRTMKIETISVEATGEPGNETVTAVCSWKRQPIFNCRITFKYKDGSLVQISGKHTADIAVTSNNTDMSSCATSLVHFLNDVKSGKYSCTQITKVDPGYNLKALGDVIGAVWRIETDNGVYFIDAVTGITEKDAQ